MGALTCPYLGGPELWQPLAIAGMNQICMYVCVCKLREQYKISLRTNSYQQKLKNAVII